MPEEAAVKEPEFDLERLTNQVEGFDDEPTSEPAPAEQVEPDSGQSPEPAADAPEPSQAGLADEDKAILDEIKALSEIQGTPFKNVKSLIDGYKNLQGEFTKVQQQTKPYKAVLDRLSQDPNFSAVVAQIQHALDNPHLLQAYAGGVAPGDPEPLPENYMDQYGQWTQEGASKWRKDHGEWQKRQLDSRFNSLKSEIETNARLDNYRREFQGKYPDITNPDELLQWGRQISGSMNPYEAAYKLKNWDNVISQVEAKVRKELASKMQEATKTKTPQGSTAKSEASVNEVIQHLAKYGRAATEKRFKPSDIDRALQLATME